MKGRSARTGDSGPVVGSTRSAAKARSGRPEISVVIPSHLGAADLPDCLASLVDQDLGARRFELLVVQHGPDDGTAAAIAAAQRRRPDLRITHLISRPGTRAAAKNAGIAASTGEQLVFVRETDRLSRGFLSGVLRQAGNAAITLPLVVEDAQRGPANLQTPAAQQSLARAGQLVTSPRVLARLLTGSGTVYARTLFDSVTFDDDLELGEDPLLLARLLQRAPLQCAVPAADEGVVYYRGPLPALPAGVPSDHLLAGLQRLAALPATAALDAVRSRLVQLATRELNSHLRRRPEDHRAVIAERARLGLEHLIDLGALNRDVARDLAVLYISVPYADTSANVAARRIHDRGQVVDVIANDMSSRCAVDDSSHALWAEYLDRRIEVSGYPSDTWWPGVSQFCRRGMRAIARQERIKGPYRSVYSRVMHPTSHFLAAWLKVRRPELTWRAELSDPVRTDIKGLERASTGDADPVMMADFRAAFRARGMAVPESDNLWLWVETVAYAFADEITFTNENQRAYMLGHFPDRQLAARAADQSVVHHHPQPAARFYSMVQSGYALPAGRVNLAYFGVFYATRGLSEVWRALEQLTAEQRQRLMLHVFTSAPQELTTQLQGAGLDDVVRANPYVSYLEYLNLASRADVLIVNDAATRGIHDVNPYLPSKWSDYSGSGKPVWGIVEPGSVLSTQPLDYRSELGDVAAATKVLTTIIETKDV